MRLRFLPVALLVVVAVLLAAGCGGGTKSVSANDVAVVGSDSITKSDFNVLLDGAKRTYKAQKKAFPAAGTTAYKSLQDQAMAYLVQESELQQEADKMGIKVADTEVASRLAQIKTQYFGGSQKKYLAQLKAQGLTEPQIKQDLYAQILSEKIYNKVTASVKVTDADVKTYYTAHKSDYTTAESRDVRHILVNNKALADSLYSQIVAANASNFAALAKKYSKDPGSAKVGGKLTVSKGQTVANFDKVAFTLKTNAISKPVHTQYGWHIIQALSDIKKAKQTPLSQVSASIKSQLLTTKKTAATNKWTADVKKEFAKKVRYQAGYEPSTTATTSTDTNATTTG
jgi:foldase protein PrsA